MKKIILFLTLSVHCFATHPVGIQWEVETTGSDSNGGGFYPYVASPGTNEGVGSSIAMTLTVTAQGSPTSVTCSPACTSTTHGPGNIFIVTSGTGCQIGDSFVELSQSGGTAVFVGSGGNWVGSNGDVCVGTFGGAMATPKGAFAWALTGDLIWVKSGTYTLTVTQAVPFNQESVAVIGYGTVHGDNGTKPLLTTATNSTVLFTPGASCAPCNFILQNLSFSNTASVRAPFMTNSGSQHGAIINCTFTGFGSPGIDLSSGVTDGFIFSGSSIVSSTGVGILFTHGGTMTIQNSYIYGNGSHGVEIGTSTVNPDTLSISDSIISGNAGSGVYISNFVPTHFSIANSTISGNGADGVTTQANLSGSSQGAITSSIVYGNTGYGLNIPVGSSPGPKLAIFTDYNGYGGNGIAAYAAGVTAGAHDVAFGATPFTNSSGQDFSLNSTSNGGKLAKGVGFPGVFPGGSTTGYRDIGAVQSQATSGSPAGAAFVQ